MTPRTGADTGAVERPVGIGTNAPPAFGSDVIADTLRALGIEYIALNPGASYRGLHDSIVNYLGNKMPQMLLCLHEEVAVAIAHGYARVTGRAMAAAVHSNVGLLHASMSIFDAWCNRSPVLVLGATGPVDAAKRRPWIDWIHTSADQGAIVRDFTKWDDQPSSPAAAREALARAAWMANSLPKGPVYVNFDAELQEMKLPEPLPPFDVAQYTPPVMTGISPAALSALAADLKQARHPLVFFGRGSRSLEAWNRRVALVETLDAQAATRLNQAAVFPTGHPAHVGNPVSIGPGPELMEAMRAADVMLCLDWVDIGGMFRALGAPPKARIVTVTLDHTIHRGWNKDYQALAPASTYIAADPDAIVEALLGELAGHVPARPKLRRNPPPAVSPLPRDKLYGPHIPELLRAATRGRDVCLTYLTISWDSARWPLHHPLDYTGNSEGGAIGAGPGVSVGVALALKGSGRLPVAVLGDGDFLMGVTAIWTAVHYRIPLLVLVANNRSFYNDEVHQERVARMRQRPVENKWIGQRISDPEIDVAALARAQGARAFGPIESVEALERILPEAIAAVDNGEVSVVDVRIEPGYLEEVSAAMMRKV